MQIGRWGSVGTSLVKSFAGQISQKLSVKNTMFRDFPGGPVAKPPHSNAGGPGSTPGQELDPTCCNWECTCPNLRFCVLQLRPNTAKKKIQCSTQMPIFFHVGNHSQIKTFLRWNIKKKKKDFQTIWLEISKHAVLAKSLFFVSALKKNIVIL